MSLTSVRPVQEFLKIGKYFERALMEGMTQRWKLVFGNNKKKELSLKTPLQNVDKAHRISNSQSSGKEEITKSARLLIVDKTCLKSLVWSFREGKTPLSCWGSLLLKRKLRRGLFFASFFGLSFPPWCQCYWLVSELLEVLSCMVHSYWNVSSFRYSLISILLLSQYNVV